MRVAALIHTATEGPGTLGAFLEKHGFDVALIRLDEGEAIPPIEDCAAVISMGGTMNVYEEDQFPFLKLETVFLANCIRAQKPVLGVCLGAQMIAKAAGAKVTKSPAQEIGWNTVTLTAEAGADTLFMGMPSPLNVFQYHEDMFHLPEGATLLAHSVGCPHQAFRINNAYGLQFHVEVTADMIAAWFPESNDLISILDGYRQRESTLVPQAEVMYTNFVRLIRNMHEPPR